MPTSYRVNSCARRYINLLNYYHYIRHAQIGYRHQHLHPVCKTHVHQMLRVLYTMVEWRSMQDAGGDHITQTTDRNAAINNPRRHRYVPEPKLLNHCAGRLFHTTSHR